MILLTIWEDVPPVMFRTLDEAMREPGRLGLDRSYVLLFVGRRGSALAFKVAKAREITS